MNAFTAIAAKLSIVCILTVVAVAHATANPTLRYVYLISDLSPHELFSSETARFPVQGDNDNLQQVAAGSSCDEDGDSAFVLASANRALISSNAIEFSIENTDVPVYLYTINTVGPGRFASDPNVTPSESPSDQWFSVERSLLSAYPDIGNAARNAVIVPLAQMHRESSSYIYHGSLPTQRILSARRIFNGAFDRGELINSNYRGLSYDEWNTAVYVPVNRNFDWSGSVTYAEFIHTFVLGCAAAAYCMEGRSALLFSPVGDRQFESTESQVCFDLKFKKMPIRNFYARKIAPILFGSDDE
ncbi:MAG: hypothetical protein JHC61_03825 [Burkholderiaceae bacterium]|nr:hypothetical protein [Burkholderiaceae bacterium]